MPSAERAPLRLCYPFDLQLSLPGSKSIANRALVTAALARGRTRIFNATLCDDVAGMVGGLQAMGYPVVIEDSEAGILYVGGERTLVDEATIDCGAGGTTLRFLISLAAVTPGTWRLNGSHRLRSRPLSGLTTAWESLGIEITHDDPHSPIVVRGGAVEGGALHLDASVTSQFASSLLLVGSRLPQGLDITLDGELASPGYVELTRDVMAAFGHEIIVGAGRYALRPGQGLSPQEFKVESDWSAAGPWLVLASMTQSRFRDDGLVDNSFQADRKLPALVASLESDGPLALDLSETPDQLMNLAILATRRRGVTRFFGVRALRTKECDRLAATQRELGRLGYRVEVEDDGLVIDTEADLPSVEDQIVRCEDDHRVAMAFALPTLLGAPTTLDDPDCVEKSYPQFWDDLDRATKSPMAWAFIGMRAAGKTTLGQHLANEIGAPFVDTDARFEEEWGPIVDFVARWGWPRFREEEEKIVLAALQPGHLVALGGGAVESARTRSVLHQSALVLWVNEDIEVIRERLQDETRPALTDKGSLAELNEIFEMRAPLYEMLADVESPPQKDLAVRAAALMTKIGQRCTW